VHIAREKGLLGEYYNDRLELIDHMHELSRRVARMKLLGVAAWDKEDYELAYAIKTGIVKLPKGELFNPESYMMDKDNAAAAKRGLLNIRRYTPYRVDYFGKQDPFPNLPADPSAYGNSTVDAGFLVGKTFPGFQGPELRFRNAPREIMRSAQGKL
jgi:hypothetical protein